MWKWLEEYFTFTKSERQALIALVIISLLVLLAPKVYFLLKPATVSTTSQYQKELDDFANVYPPRNHDELEEVPVDSANETKKPEVAATIDDTGIPVQKKKTYTAHYFKFDPNKIGVPEWVQLGFTERQAATIEKYKAKGGKFYKPTDLKRLYVMTDEHYARLEPFVNIDVDALPKRDYRQRNE